MAGNTVTAFKIAIDIAGVTMVYPGASTFKALDDVSISIGENEFFTLLGPSGCGKTTLLRLIAGFEQPSAGELKLDGTSLVGKMPHQRPVNTVFQSYALFPHMTVAQNIAFALEMQGRSPASVQPVVEQMLALVRLDGLGARRPSQLSGGQQQRVALARALASRPRVLLLDESLSALDLQLRKEMQVELKRLQRETGITFVFVTHDQEEALTMSDRIAVMHGGRVQQIGTPAEIYDQPANRFVAGFIGETNLLSVHIQAGRVMWGGSPLGSCVVPDASWHDGDATLAVRPERMQLAFFDAHAYSSGDDERFLVLRGMVSNAVYRGHDTLYTVAVEGQLPCHIRLQNAQGAQQAFFPGSDVAVRIPAVSLRLLAD